MSLSRRNLLHIAGGTAASLGWSKYFQPLAQAQTSGPQSVTTSCGYCDSSCGMRCTVQNGILNFIEGLPEDMHAQGGLCAKGASAAGFLYDADRLKYPMRRTNPRKALDQDPGWQRISWNEALDTIANRWRDTISKHGADSLLVLSRNSPDVFTRLLNALGVVNRVDHLDICYTADTVVQRYTVGSKSFAADLENARYILLFGWDLVARSKIAHARGLVAARANGAKIVCFNPEYTATARMANEWYPIKPASDLAVALAMINVIVSENLYNREFVSEYTNFSRYEAEIRNHFAQYTPEWASEQSDMPAGAIVRIAREFASQGPGLVPCHKKTPAANHANATQTVHAISILNILAGTIDRPGGRYFPRQIAIPAVDAIYPPPAYPPKRGVRVDGRDKLPLVHEADQGLFCTLADGMLRKHPGHIKAALVSSYSLQSFPQSPEIAEALQSVEFLTAIDVLPSDVTLLADIVLPSTTFLENNDLIARNTVAKFPQVIARQAVVPAMFEARSMGSIAVELGRRLAPDYFRTETGSVISTSALLDERVRRAGLGQSFAEFRRLGILTREQPFVPRTSFATPGGKCQIYVPQFAEKGYNPLPDWRTKRDMPSAEYPFYYLTYLPAVHRRTTTQNNKMLHAMQSTNTVKVHTSVAERLGLRNGQLVRVRSRAGVIELPLETVERLRPDCVLVAHGFGHRSRLLTLAGGKGVNDGDVIPGMSVEEMIALGDFGGSGCIMDAAVALEPA